MNWLEILGVLFLVCVGLSIIIFVLFYSWTRYMLKNAGKRYIRRFE
jgi:hypothetical protein